MPSFSTVLKTDRSPSTATSVYEDVVFGSIRDAARGKILSNRPHLYPVSSSGHKVDERTSTTEPIKKEFPGVFLAIQEWEGYVESIVGDKFTAILIDISSKKAIKEKEYVEMQISDLNKDNLSLLKVGAVFRWAIGYFHYNGQKNRMSKLVFRRLPALSEQQKADAKLRSAQIMSAISFVEF